MTQPPAKPPVRYEYLVFQSTAENPNPALNALGDQGFRMVHFAVTNQLACYVMERMIIDPEDDPNDAQDGTP